ncbi:MAG: ComEA family DNA-binding protein [Bifidobacteriaceae bacterium]|jgi:competence protein ComEA|nr:ComEA family DNA-binding protein [Bifidobacteriaceae bacterium]
MPARSTPQALSARLGSYVEVPGQNNLPPASRFEPPSEVGAEPSLPLGTPDDVLARLRLRARLTQQEAQRLGTHRRPRFTLKTNRWTVAGVALMLGLVAIVLVLPALVAGLGQAPAGAAPSVPGVEWSGPASPSPTAVVVVYVTGAVATPGVVELPSGARLAQALERAGGTLDGADLTVLNLAALLQDGERIYVPLPGETPPPVWGPGGQTNTNSGSTSSEANESSASINVNTATAEALTALPGIGPVLAQRLVDWREQNGPFTRLSDLGEVNGIGPKLLAGLADSVTF